MGNQLTAPANKLEHEGLAASAYLLEPPCPFGRNGTIERISTCDNLWLRVDYLVNLMIDAWKGPGHNRKRAAG